MNLIICEGSGEIAFLYAYLKKKGYTIKKEKDKLYEFAKSKKYLENEIVDKLSIINLNGNGNLEKIVDRLLKSPIEDIKQVKKIGFFVDAESNFEDIKGRILKIREKIIQELSIEVHYYISPYNNGYKGMLEDLIMEISKDKILLTFIESKTFPELNEKVEEQNEKIKNHTKAKFMIYGATQNPMNGVAHLFLTENETINKLDFESNKLEKFHTFMKNFDII